MIKFVKSVIVVFILLAITTFCGSRSATSPISNVEVVDTIAVDSTLVTLDVDSLDVK